MNKEVTVYTTCRMCGRKLKSEESRVLGFGPTCYAKYKKQMRRKKRLIENGVLHDEAAGGVSK